MPKPTTQQVQELLALLELTGVLEQMRNNVFKAWRAGEDPLENRLKLEAVDNLESELRRME